MNKREDVEDIVRKACLREKIDFQSTYDALRIAVANGTSRVFRHGNTLLFYNIIGNGVAEPHLITSEPLMKIVDAVKAFMKCFKRANFHTLITQLTDPRFKVIYNRAHLKYKISTDRSGTHFATIEV